MKWEVYQKKFIESAQAKQLSSENIDFYLNYAKKLHDNKLPIIFDVTHFSKLVGYNASYIRRACKSTYYFYRHYKIPKKNGGMRLIAEPLPSLKEIQKWILFEILYKNKNSVYAKAYIKKRNLKSNAFFHKNKDAVLTIDISDFFGSIKIDKVFSLFENLGYNKEVSDILSKICTLNNSLPQGAPTSPCISNLISINIDNTIGVFCKKRKINFTRYSDDLTFSGNKKIGGIVPFVEKQLNKNGFIINRDKLRVRERHQCQEVTGIVVNQKMQAPKAVRKKFRQAVHYIKTYGLENHLSKIKNNKRNYLRHILGIGNFICFVNPHDVLAKEDLEYLKKLKQQDINI